MITQTGTTPPTLTQDPTVAPQEVPEGQPQNQIQVNYQTGLSHTRLTFL